MKNLKKLLAVVISLTILLSMAVPVFAADLTPAEAVELIGVLRGEGNGVDSVYLAKATTRVQGAVILLRLLGKEDEAAAYAGTDNFKDVVGNEWFAPYLAYLKANPALGFVGYTDGSFQPRKIMTGAELYKVLLTALGYKQDVDYTWAEVAAKAAELGLVALTKPAEAINNGDLANAILEALQADKKDGVTLVDYLIAEKVISVADANAAGLISELAIVSAVPSNADEITVTFNKPVEGSPAITVKSGFVSSFVTATWNTAKTQVVLKKSNNFQAGTYEVTVGALKASVKIEKEVAASVAFDKGTLLVMKDAADAEPEFEVVLYNQYGKKMSTAGQNFTATAFNRTTGATLLVTPLGGAKFKIKTLGVKENEIITITAMHHQSTIVGQADVTAVNADQVTQFAMTGVVLPKDADKLMTTHTNVEIKYEAYNQYGNKMTIKNVANVNAAGLTFVTSNDNILKIADLKFDANGKLIWTQPLKSGSITLSVLVNSAGVVTSLPITVFDPAAVNKVVIGEALKEVVEGEVTEISFIALDQFGNELDKKKVADWSKLTFSPVMTDPTKISFNIADGVLKVSPLVGSKGYVTVYYYWNGALLGSFNLNVWAKAEPTGIEGVTFNGGVELNATQSIAKTAIKVVDQYGRPYDVKGKMVVGDFTWTTKSGTAIGNATVNGDAWDFVAGAAEGSVTYEVKITAKADTEYSITMKAFDVDKAANGVTYSFASIPTLYTNAGFADKATAGEYAKKLTLTGKTSDGTVVTLLPGKIDKLTSSNANVKVEKVGGDWFVFSANKDAQTSTLRAYDAKAKLLCSADVTAKADRSVQTITFAKAKSIAKGTTLDLAVKYGDLELKVTDDYGVNMLSTTVPAAFDLVANGFFASSDQTKLTVAGKTITAVAEGEVTLNYVTNSGMKASIVITVTP